MMYKSFYLIITSVSNALLNTHSVCCSFCSFLNKLFYFPDMYSCPLDNYFLGKHLFAIKNPLMALPWLSLI